MHKGSQHAEVGMLHTLFICQKGLFVPKIHVDVAIRNMKDILGLISPTYFSFSQPKFQRIPPTSIDHHLLGLQCAQI